MNHWHTRFLALMSLMAITGCGEKAATHPVRESASADHKMKNVVDLPAQGATRDEPIRWSVGGTQYEYNVRLFTNAHAEYESTTGMLTLLDGAIRLTGTPERREYIPRPFWPWVRAASVTAGAEGTDIYLYRSGDTIVMTCLDGKVRFQDSQMFGTPTLFLYPGFTYVQPGEIGLEKLKKRK